MLENNTAIKMTDSIKSITISHREAICEKAFKDEYVKKAIPVVLTDLTKDWPATKKWNFDYLAENHGDLEVPLYSSKPATGKQHQHAAAITMPLKKFFGLIQQGENDLRMFFYNLLENAPALIKDFQYPKIGLPFMKRLPVLFAAGKGAKVQMHYDIDYAHLLLCHFGGKKTVLLIPPEQTSFMYKVPYSFSSLYDVDFSNPNFKKYPALKELNGYKTELKHGDSLYIPPGYWHYITYDEPGFSMTLRSLPRKFSHQLLLLKNIFVTRTVEGLMRKFVGQSWNDRNEALAVKNTHKNLIKNKYKG